MTAKELRKKFIEFFVEKGHKEIPSASLLPENDPSTLFISAGMHPLVPYLLGETHPSGKRLCSIQKCLRTGDIDYVGDGFHNTFFEMLGNWSLGDYWKDQMIPLSFEFLTKVLNIPIEKLSVTCFAGDKDAPKDEETASLWEKAGVPKERIYFLPKKDNWWGPAGKTGPCGPDSEMFFDTEKEKCGDECKPGCSCGKYIEIWNDVFMGFRKQETLLRSANGGTTEGQAGNSEQSKEEYEFVELSQRNIDTGMGVERTTAVTSGYLDDNYRSELFWPIIKKIEEISKKSYELEENRKPMRIIADHIRAAVFVITDGVVPSNTEQGYVLRRLIRRSIRYAKTLEVKGVFTGLVAEIVIQIMGDTYPEITKSKDHIFKVLLEEENGFLNTLQRGLKEFNDFLEKNKNISGKDAFFLYETYGFPLELTIEMAKEKEIVINEDDFIKAQEEHQQKSRLGADKKFSGGLADQSEITTKYHTATHLLHKALRDLLGDGVHQAGSNITSERLRFDFTYPEKLTLNQIEEIQNKVNEKIKQSLPVIMEVMKLQKAKEEGALAFFDQKYSEDVKVFSIGGYSKEVCGGPHVNNTAEIKGIEIYKEESCGAGKRRLYARLINN